MGICPGIISESRSRNANLGSGTRTKSRRIVETGTKLWATVSGRKPCGTTNPHTPGQGDGQGDARNERDRDKKSRDCPVPSYVHP